MQVYLKISCILIFLSLNSLVRAQEIYFSQFNASPLNLNPALTGHFSGDWRVSGNYRNQWKNISIPFKTTSVAFDRQFYWKNQRIGGGITFVNDNSGHVALKVNKIAFSGAYHTERNNHQLSAGLQAGYVFKHIDFGSLTFPDQFNMGTGYFDPTLESGELGAGENTSYLDLAMGLNWSKKFGRLAPEAGWALFHFNVPNESFTGTRAGVPLRSVLHGSARVSITDAMYITPRILHMKQRKTGSLMAGADLGFLFRPNRTNVNEAFGGVYYREASGVFASAFVVVGGINFRNFDIAMSYDLNAFPSSTGTGNQGAFELSFIYKSVSTVLNTFTIPCERF